jgi:transporter family-2 protein
VDSKALAVMATAFAGGLVAMQAPINSGLGKAIGSLPAASFSFAIGLVALVGITFVSGEGFGQLGEVGGLSWYYLIGGLLGAVYVTTVLISVRSCRCRSCWTSSASSGSHSASSRRGG